MGFPGLEKNGCILAVLDGFASNTAAQAGLQNHIQPEDSCGAVFGKKKAAMFL